MSCRLPLLSMGGCGKGPCDRLITLLVFDQKIQGWLIKIMFLGEEETAVRSDINFRFGVRGF